MISRALVAILLMMNLGVAAWWLWGPGPQSPRVSEAAIPGIPVLRLLAEREPAAAPEPSPSAATEVESAAMDVAPDVVTADVAPAAEPLLLAGVAETGDALAVASDTTAAASEVPVVLADAAEPVASPPPQQCFSIGPFVALDDVRRISALIEASLQRQQVREVQSREVRGYRVFLPAFPIRQDAMDAARALQEKGLRDYYVVTAGEQENTVSLGLFRDLANAESRREQVRGFGFEPRLEPRQQELTRWWLDIAVAADDDAWRQQATRYPGTRIESLVCE